MAQDMPSKPVAPLVLIGVALITFTAWTWGGVVLWAQWVVFSLGMLGLAHELLADPSGHGRVGSNARKALARSLVAGLIVAAWLCWRDYDALLRERAATLQLIPSAEFAPIKLADWLITGLLSGWTTFVVSLVAAGIASQSSARRRLIRQGVFWAGLALFVWIVCQASNTWGVVVQRDLFWYVSPHDYITWLPSGLDAPFASNEEPGGMNGWRQMLILAGPWAFFCSLRISSLGRRHYEILAVAAILNAVGIAVAGHLSHLMKWRDFLGFQAHDTRHVIFGPFVYRNHAGCYLYMVAALALALMFQLVDRRGHRADQGGPHLIAGFAALLLLLAAASTMSMGASVAASVLALYVPVAYFADRRIRVNVSPAPLLLIFCLFGVLFWAASSTKLANKWFYAMESKKIQLVVDGEDSRAALRAVSLNMLLSADTGRIVSGYGAGTFRWVSPSFMAQQPEFLSRKGVLSRRASFAHNDWAQALLEWGLMGLFVVGAALWGLLRLGIRAALNPSAALWAIGVCIAVFALHAFFDFLLFQPLLIVLALSLAWARCLARHENDLFRTSRQGSL